TFAYREHSASAKKDLKRTVAGAWSMVRAEQGGCYPGGRERAAQRRRILTRHARPVTLSCLQQGMQWEAWTLYRATFAWNASLGRVKYLAAFPMRAAMPLALDWCTDCSGDGNRPVRELNSLEKT